jgi:hypothetical protein
MLLLQIRQSVVSKRLGYGLDIQGKLAVGRNVSLLQSAQTGSYYYYYAPINDCVEQEQTKTDTTNPANLKNFLFVSAKFHQHH